MKNKTLKQNTVSGLGILAILIFGVIITPAKTNAQRTDGYFGGYTISESSNNQNYYQAQNYYPNYYQATNNPAPIYYSTAPIIYSNSTSPNATSAATAPKTVAKIKTTSTKTDTDSNLAASVILGSNSFMPSSLIQWIFFAILVLLVVILVRKIYGGKEKYDAIPMKFD